MISYSNFSDPLSWLNISWKLAFIETLDRSIQEDMNQNSFDDDDRNDVFHFHDNYQFSLDLSGLIS